MKVALSTLDTVSVLFGRRREWEGINSSTLTLFENVQPWSKTLIFCILTIENNIASNFVTFVYLCLLEIHERLSPECLSIENMADYPRPRHFDTGLSHRSSY